MECRIRGNLKYICEVCGKNRTEFKSAKSFWNHSCIKNRVKCLQLQLLESKFKTCDICQERFASKSQLNAHAKTHQVLTCKVCHKGFASNANLKRHLLVHNN